MYSASQPSPSYRRNMCHADRHCQTKTATLSASRPFCAAPCAALPFLLLLECATLAAAEPPPANAPFDARQARAHQEVWADHLGVPIKITNSLKMTFVLIPPGRFTMGSPPEEEWHQADEIQHEVTITKPFYLGTTEVTQSQWQAVMKNNSSFSTGDDLPVDTVTWEDAVVFCQKLSRREGKTYRLPTEAEWEYACRAGTTTPFFTGKTITPEQANYDGTKTYGDGPKGVFRETSTPVGSFPANPWGLHDMHGNLWEWCADWYGPYPAGPVSDPKGPPTGEARVIRGGCWINFPAVCRSTTRGKTVPVSWNFNFGFRVALDLD